MHLCAHRTRQQAALRLGARACEGRDVGSSQEKVPQEADVGVDMGARAREWQGGAAMREERESRSSVSSHWLWCIEMEGLGEGIVP